MKKIITIMFIVLFCFSLIAYEKRQTSSDDAKNMLSLSNNGVTSIKVSSLPEKYNYSFSDDDANKIIDYLLNLNLTPYYEENLYVGMTCGLLLLNMKTAILQRYITLEMF